MKDLLSKFENKSPQIVFEWNDSETEARGWVVINSLRGGAAGGGTRMRIGLDRHEVESLAKTMEIKFTVSGPAIGGAKSGIDFDPADPRKTGVLQRWYKAVMPLLKNYYGTGGDLNIDEIHEVIPITEGFGLWHPQEGVVNGHFNPAENEKIHKIGQLRIGVSKVIEDNSFSPDLSRKYKIADMITGFGVSESVRHFYDIWGGDLVNKRVIIQGWGNVGAAAGYYLSFLGAKIVGIIDRNGGLINENGFSHQEIKDLFLSRVNNALVHPDLIPYEKIMESIWNTKHDVFIPAAASRMLTDDHVEKLAKAGVEVIACGANVPFADKEIFFGPIAEKADTLMSVIPDFVSNCGMARVFAYLMGRGVEVTDEAIFKDVSDIIRNAMIKIHKTNPGKKNITASAFTISLKQLV